MNASIEYSWQLVTVTIAHLDLIARFLHHEFNLTYNEFALLMAMDELEVELDTDELSELLILKKQTTWSLLIGLEDREMILKFSDDKDKRIMKPTLTPQGRCFIKTAKNAFDTAMREAFIGSLPLDELSPAMMRETMNHLRYDDSVRLNSIHENGDYSFDFLVFWRSLHEHWKDICISHNLSLNEYRILEQLDTAGSMNPKDIAKRLFMQKSGVSLYSKKMNENGLISRSRDEKDKRVSMFHITKQGASIYGKVRPDIERATKSRHHLKNEHDAMVLNSWYFRMYANIREHALHV
jgi:DNA-binding MarR family transcriptional regulator